MLPQSAVTAFDSHEKRGSLEELSAHRDVHADVRTFLLRRHPRAFSLRIRVVNLLSMDALQADCVVHLASFLAHQYPKVRRLRLVGSPCKQVCIGPLGYCGAFVPRVPDQGFRR